MGYRQKNQEQVREDIVLLHLSIEPSHGYKLHKILVEQKVANTAEQVYRVLRNLEKNGLVRARWDTTKLAESGPPRRVYKVTSKGRKVVDQAWDRVNSHKNYLADLLDLVPE